MGNKKKKQQTRVPNYSSTMMAVIDAVAKSKPCPEREEALKAAFTPVQANRQSANLVSLLGKTIPDPVWKKAMLVVTDEDLMLRIVTKAICKATLMRPISKEWKNNAVSIIQRLNRMDEPHTFEVGSYQDINGDGRNGYVLDKSGIIHSILLTEGVDLSRIRSLSDLTKNASVQDFDYKIVSTFLCIIYDLCEDQQKSIKNETEWNAAKFLLKATYEFATKSFSDALSEWELTNNQKLETLGFMVYGAMTLFGKSFFSLVTIIAVNRIFEDMVQEAHCRSTEETITTWLSLGEINDLNILEFTLRKEAAKAEELAKKALEKENAALKKEAEKAEQSQTRQKDVNQAYEAKIAQLEKSLRLAEHERDKAIADKEKAEEALSAVIDRIDNDADEQNNEPEQESERQDDETASATTISYPYRTAKRIVIFGGHATWVKAMKERFPDCAFYYGKDETNFDSIPGADLLIFQTNALSHTAYNPAKNIANKNDVPVEYMTFAGVNATSRQLVGMISNLSSVEA